MPKTTEGLLLTALPLILVLLALVGGIILLPYLQTDPRSRASSPTPTPGLNSPIVFPATTETEAVCSLVYENSYPVCDQNSERYDNLCHALEKNPILSEADFYPCPSGQ